LTQIYVGNDEHSYDVHVCLSVCVFCQNAWFKKNRFQQQKAKKLNIGGAGLGQRERPGLGAKSVR